MNLNETRRTLMASFESIIRYYNKIVIKKSLKVKLTMFDLGCSR